MKSIPQKYHDLLSDEKRAFAFVATIMKDCEPQVTPMWFNTDGEHILVNSAIGRVKDRNMRARPNVALAIMDPDNPYRYFQIRGRVVEVNEDGAEDHIHALSRKHHGRDYDLPAGQKRVIYKIRPEHVSGMR